MLRRWMLLLWIGVSGAAWAQPETLAPPEPGPPPPPPRKQTSAPTIAPGREAVWLFEEAKRLHRDGSFVRAADTYRKALAKDPGRLEYRPYLAIALDQIGSYSEAKEQFDIYLKLEPKDYRIRLQRVATLIHLGSYDEAGSELEAVKLSESGLPFYHEMVGLLAMRLNHPEQAVDAYAIVLSQDGSRMDARVNMAQAYLALGQTEKAQEQLDLAMKAGPKGVVLNNLGVLKSRAGELPAAQKLFEQAWGPPVGDAAGVNDALLNLATVLAQQDKNREALLTVARLLDLQSDNIDGRILYARLLARADRLAEARKEIDKVVDLGPEALGPRWSYVCEVSGFIALKAGDADVARADLEKAVLADPKSVSARHNLSMILGSTGSLEDAISEELAASAMAPSNKTVWYHLGVLYDLDARPKLAISAYQKFLALAPKDPEASGLKEHIAELQQQLDGTVGQPLPKGK